MPKLLAPIFIMSSERSGSNLLRVLLGNHSNIASPVAAQLLSTVSPHARYYWPFSVRGNARALFDEIRRVVNHEYHAWNLDADFASFFDDGRRYTFMDFVDFFYSECGRREAGKKRVVLKENVVFDYAFELLHYFTDAKFIYLYRDPRDYVASWMRVPLGYESPERAIRTWMNEQIKCEQVINVFGLPCCHVKYEELIADPAGVMSKVLGFVGEAVEEACFSTDPDRNKSVIWNAYWNNLDKPVMKENTGQFRKLFDEETIRWVEHQCKEQMIKLGYEPLYGFAAPLRETSFLGKVLRRLQGRKTFKQPVSNAKTSQLLKERQLISKEIGLNAQRYFQTAQDEHKR
jgi:hypothetical protein